MAFFLDVTLDGLRQVQGRIDQRRLDDGDWPIFGAFVSSKIAGEEARRDRLLAKIAAARATEAASTLAQAGNGMTSADGEVIDAEHTVFNKNEQATGDNAPRPEPTDQAKPPVKGRKRGNDERPKGHGRNGAGAFSNAKIFFHTLAGIIGSICAGCKAGRMTRHRPQVTIRIVGQPMFGAERHHAEQARCKACGRVISALPMSILSGLGKAVTYDWSACAMLIVLHYLYGLPFKRIESLHKAWGIPFSDANQWQVSHEAVSLLFPLIKALIAFAIQNVVSLRMDDTGSVIVTIKRQIAAELAAAKALGLPEDSIRTGINASGFYIETPLGVILLYFTGRHHAAEILRELLQHRLPGSPKISKITDGASKNFDAELAEMLDEGVCNAHAFLKFHDVKELFPAEYAVVGEAYNKIYEAEARTRTDKLSPEERLLFHQLHSRPWMEKIKTMCEEKVVTRLVEPRSPLWEPIHFFINQWSRLTKFLEIPGMPLDTNLCEQALIAPVRYLAASFNYHTPRGAETGDRAMSLAATARANDVDPVAWLTDCLANHKDLTANPERYFPWIYRDRTEAAKPPPHLG